MKTQAFIATVTVAEKGLELPGEALFVFQKAKASGRLEVYALPVEGKGRDYPVWVSLRRSLSLKWKDQFDILDTKSQKVVGQGRVLYPCLPKGTRSARKVDPDFLRAFGGNEKTMLDALCREKGFSGLRQAEILDFTALEPSRLFRLAQKLEEEGKVKILSFWPLFLISEESFRFLLEQIMRYVENYQEKHPARKGTPLERIQKRYGLPRLVFQLALKALEQSGRARREGQRLVLPSHEVKLSPEEERILSRLEEMCFRGELRSLSREEIGQEFRLSPERLDNLLAILVERKKIIQGADGLYIHAHWLEDVIGRVRSLAKKEMTVGDFKALTGLSRKYAIPLLELLDQMGVTRRKGPIREIL